MTTSVDKWEYSQTVRGQIWVAGESRNMHGRDGRTNGQTLILLYHHMVRCSAMRYGSMQCSAVQCNAVRCDAI